MREGFFALNVAVRGLYTAQRGLDVVNHNINNVNTPGYSRQAAVQQAGRPLSLMDGTGMLGTGSDVVAVNRVRDEYLDFKYWTENQMSGEWATKNELLNDVEATFNEPSDSGYTKITSDFYNAMQELAKNPDSEATRAVVREKAVTLTKYFNSTYAHFEKMQGDINYRVKTKVEEVNSLGKQIQQLNRQIYTSELDGNSANDLRDSRTLLVDKLSKIINIDANEVTSGTTLDGKPDKHFVITISGKAFIDHFNLSELASPQRTTAATNVDITGLNEVSWADGNKLEVRSGELKGLLDVRDGTGVATTIIGQTDTIFKGIPYYMEKLNEYVQTFAMRFNEGFTNISRNPDGTVNKGLLDPATATIADIGVSFGGIASGYEMNSVTGDTTPSGVRFFTTKSYDGTPNSTATFLSTAITRDTVVDRYSFLTAKNITVGLEVMNDSKMVCLSDVPGQKSNINVLNNLLKDRNDPHMFTEGSPEDFMKSLVTTLGIDSQQSQIISKNQEVMIKQIVNRRLSDSGVSIDEEMTSLVKFQQAYGASAKMINTMAELYDTLINKLGVV